MVALRADAYALQSLANFEILGSSYFFKCVLYIYSIHVFSSLQVTSVNVAPCQGNFAFPYIYIVFGQVVHTYACVYIYNWAISSMLETF